MNNHSLKTLKKKKLKRNKTFKKKNGIFALMSRKKLEVGFLLYAAKMYQGDKLLEYQRNAEIKSKNHCLLDNSSWFGNLQSAKQYKTTQNHIYKWSIKNTTTLLTTNKANEGFFKELFLTTHVKLVPTIQITEKILEKINYIHPYLTMTEKEKSWFEFQFAFGYMTLKQQFDFLQLLYYLLENDFINLTTREGTSIIKKIKQKMLYYHVFLRIFHYSHKQKYNRISFYSFDKHSVMNLCKLLSYNKNNTIAGLYQKNNSSFWFPNFVIYKMNIEEYILFNSHKNLVYDSIVL